ncbi:MAG: histidine phosphatase family protein [Candidatus Sericytochromatia bacterium]
MSDVIRLTLVSHAMTDAMTAARFPDNEPLNGTGLQVSAMRFGATQLTAVSGPEQRCLQTAELLGLQPVVEPLLADLNCGRWRGETLGALDPADVGAWLDDPASAPHGGESVAELIDRVAGWLSSLTTRPSRTVAVTHPAVVRAAILLALDAPPKSFWRIDIGPASRTEMHFRGAAWTLRLL